MKLRRERHSRGQLPGDQGRVWAHQDLEAGLQVDSRRRLACQAHRVDMPHLLQTRPTSVGQEEWGPQVVADLARAGAWAEAWGGEWVAEAPRVACLVDVDEGEARAELNSRTSM